MSRPLVNPVVPSREADRWLYETLRRLQDGIDAHSMQIAAIDRGESPSLGGSPLITIQKHSDLLNLTFPYDDHTQYAHLPGRVGGQILNGGSAATNAVSGTWANGGNFTSKNNKTSLTTWSGIAIDTSASVGDIIVLALSTLAFSLSINALTSNHLTLTDTKGNTWTKQREHSFCDGSGAGGCFSVWTCVVGTALTAGVDTLTATFISAIGAQAISSHRFTGTSTTLAIAGITSLGEQSFVGPEPSALTLSGLSTDKYLFVRHSLLGFYSGALPGYSATTNYTPFDHGQSGTSGGSGNVASFGEYRILSDVTGDTSNPAVGGGGSYVSIYVAFTLSPTPTGSLTLRSQNSNSLASKITLAGQTMTVNADYINFQAPGGSSTLSYIRGSDGALIDKTILGTESTSDPGSGNYLTLTGFNNPPIAGTTSITARSAQILLSKDVNLYVDNFLVVERNTSYNAANGFSVATGLGFVNVTTVGTQTITGDSGPSGALLEIDHTNAGLTIIDFIIKKRLNQTGDMTEWQDDTGTKMSYIRASDGAFVGPVIASGSDTHIDNVFSILDNVDPTKIAQFQVSAISTATTRTFTLPNVDCTLLATTSVNGQRIGTAAQTGNSDDIATSGRVSIGTGSFAAEQMLVVQGNLTQTLGTRQLARITPTIATSGAGASYRGVLVQLSGGGSITSGSPSAIGAVLSAVMTIQSAITVTEIVGLDNTASWGYTNSLAVCSALIGLRGKATGANTQFGDTVTQNAIWGIQAQVTSGGPKTSDLVGIKLTLDSVNKMFGYTARTVGIDLDRFGDTTGVYWSSSAYSCTVTGASNTLTNVTNAASIHVGQYITGTNIPSGTYVTAVNVGALTVTMNNLASGGGSSVTIWGTTGKWIGISCTTPLPIGGEVIAARFISQEVDIPSQHYGKLYLRPPTPSSWPTPTAYLHIGAGTATANTAPLKFTSGTLLTTAEAGAVEFLTDDFYITITTGAARKGIVLNDGTNLTSGRIPFATTNGRLTDDPDFTFAVDTLTITKIAATTFTGDVTLSDVNLILGTTTGTKLGTATTQKLGFWNAAPIVQPTTAVAAATLVGGGGIALTDTDTFDGYTLKQIVKALRNTGILA